MARKRGLGRGLDALLGGAEGRGAAPQDSDEELRQLPVDRVRRGRFQPRVHFDQASLQELADSILTQGVVQPIVVREQGDGFELIAGERRWRACQLAGVAEIPAVVRQLDDRAAAAVALIENVQREDLNPLEEASALQRLGAEFDLTHQQIADAVGRSRAAVSNLLRLLELAEPVKQMLQRSELEMGHARALLSLAVSEQPAAAHKVVRAGLTVRQTEALVRRLMQPRQPAAPAGPAPVDRDIRALEQELAEKLGLVVTISHQASGKGRLQIAYASLDELDGVLTRLR